MEDMTIPITSRKDKKMAPLRPSISIHNIYGDGFIYNSKLYSEDYQHFSKDILSLEALTGREMTVVEDTPVICHEATATKPALRLLEKAGLHIPNKLYTYRTEDEYLALLSHLQHNHKKLIFQYPHPNHVASSELFWVDPKILTYLCDKRSIPHIVPVEHVPKRKMMSIKEIMQRMPKLPFVLKTGDGRPTSGGYGVLLVTEEKQLHELGNEFGDLSNLIVEEFIPNEKNVSVHYFVDKEGKISFLGKSEQMVNKDGYFQGSWITIEKEEYMAPIVRTGYKVMGKLAEKGYIGVAGFDVLISDENYYFIDLNIRFNASTCGLLLCRDIYQNYGKKTVRLTNLEWNGNFDQLLSIVEKYLLREQFVPLSLLDASYFSIEKKTSKVVGLCIGHSALEVEKILKEMEKDSLFLKE
ncbi:ATP-grasp domain-containing protein [Bacillus sp. FJAT-49711]|uniref:ATP-grasp domain-containing protein n=1 Tax=Bacillus sp. FJAT-49711 TaxID=2833585 RepID=UPI001BCA3318|nr:ATP-grasp domain-containing protein [Bacillus sp. FJAT-49711]MBS4219483.1 ATP-grasp domain-containing protein [Bacillus sp. FJAT-49711]